MQPAGSPVPPRRVEFLPDATTATLVDLVGPGEVRTYVMRADLGQALLIAVLSTSNEVHLGLRTEGGTSILSLATGHASWRGAAPDTEDYYIDIQGGSTASAFTLSVKKPRKIKFKEGAASARILDRAVGGTPMAYSVLAIKDEELDIGLSGTGSQAALSVTGYVDGHVYLDAEDGETGFSMKVPVTQDYIVEVVPGGSQTLNFALAFESQ
jgi:hypothetical protein